MARDKRPSPKVANPVESGGLNDTERARSLTLSGVQQSFEGIVGVTQREQSLGNVI